MTNRKYIGAYKDERGRVRPITARTSTGATGLPIRANTTKRNQAGGVRNPEPIKPFVIIAHQLESLNPSWRSRYKVNQLIQVDENTLGLQIKDGSKNQLKVHIKYVPGSDTYSVTVYEIKRDLAVHERYHEDGFYTDNLETVLDYVILKRDFNKDEVIVEGI